LRNRRGKLCRFDQSNAARGRGARDFAGKPATARAAHASLQKSHHPTTDLLKKGTPKKEQTNPIQGAVESPQCQRRQQIAGFIGRNDMLPISADFRALDYPFPEEETQ
jgi:hypothetical protein